MQSVHTHTHTSSSPSHLYSSLLPSFTLGHFLSSFLLPLLCFLPHSSSGQVLSHESPLQVSFYSLYSYLWLLNAPATRKKLCKTDRKIFRFPCVGHRVYWSLAVWLVVAKSGSAELAQTPRRLSRLNCGSFCFLPPRQWFSASILHTTVVIYGNYPSLGSSINWLLLGDGNSCCLVGLSSTVRGNVRWIQRKASMKKRWNILFCSRVNLFCHNFSRSPHPDRTKIETA